MSHLTSDLSILLDHPAALALVVIAGMLFALAMAGVGVLVVLRYVDVAIYRRQSGTISLGPSYVHHASRIPQIDVDAEFDRLVTSF